MQRQIYPYPEEDLLTEKNALVEENDTQIG